MLCCWSRLRKQAELDQRVSNGSQRTLSSSPYRKLSAKSNFSAPKLKSCQKIPFNCQHTNLENSSILWYLSGVSLGNSKLGYFPAFLCYLLSRWHSCCQPLNTLSRGDLERKRDGVSIELTFYLGRWTIKNYYIICVR